MSEISGGGSVAQKKKNERNDSYLPTA